MVYVVYKHRWLFEFDETYSNFSDVVNKWSVFNFTINLHLIFHKDETALLNAFTFFVHSEPQSRPTFQEILDKLKELQKKFTIQLQASRTATAATATATSGENNSQKESWNAGVNYFDPFYPAKYFAYLVRQCLESSLLVFTCWSAGWAFVVVAKKLNGLSEKK